MMDNKRAERFFNALTAIAVTAGIAMLLIMMAAMTADIILGHERVEIFRDWLIPRTKPLAR